MCMDVKIHFLGVFSGGMIQKIHFRPTRATDLSLLDQNDAIIFCINFLNQKFQLSPSRTTLQGVNEYNTS